MKIQIAARCDLRMVAASYFMRMKEADPTRRYKFKARFTYSCGKEPGHAEYVSIDCGITA